MKLSKRQKEVLADLENGAQIITDREMRGAIISSHSKQYRINNRVFFNLVNKGIIYQEQKWPFNYVLNQERGAK